MSKESIFDKATREWDAGNVKEAFTLFTLAAEQGDSYAQNSLGYFYDNGIAVPKNITEALFWYKKAAQKGDVCSISNIGTVYRDAGNFRLARLWFIKALERGDGDAALELGKLYLKKQTRRATSIASRYLRLALKSKSICDDSLEQARKLLKSIEAKVVKS